MLRRYDLASETAECMKVAIVDMNGGVKWHTIKEGVQQLENAVMSTRRNLDRRKVLRMVIEIFRASN